MATIETIKAEILRKRAKPTVYAIFVEGRLKSDLDGGVYWSNRSSSFDTDTGEQRLSGELQHAILKEMRCGRHILKELAQSVV